MKSGFKTFLIFLQIFALSCLFSCVTVGPPDTPKTVKSRKGGFYHRVLSGEDLFDIARKYNISLNYLATVNKINKYDKLDQGKYIYIPSLENREGKTVAYYEDNNAQPVPKGSDPDPVQNYSSADSGNASNKSKPTASASKNQGGKTVSTSAPASAYGYKWPVNGKVSRGYIDNTSEKHKGIDILAPSGTPVTASKAGKVIYEGDSMPGYGNMIIVDHGDGYASLYAHNKKNLVRANKTVRQGDKIAEVGQTGRATANHVHFEIRKNAVAVNPHPLMP